jgi:hypothetical protein
MVKLEAFGTIESGKLHIIHANRFREAIKTLSDGRYKIIVEKNYRKRSNPQNAVIWGYVYPMVLDGLRDAGYDNMDIDKVHELLKFKFLKYDLINQDGEVLESVRSTASLTTIEMMQYLSDIQKFAAEYLNIVIPDPGENFEIKFNENESK